MSHAPVMTKEVIEFLAPKAGGVYVDGSFGGGGHTRAILESADCSVVAIDKDPEAIARAAPLLEIYADRLLMVHGCLSHLEQHLAANNLSRVDGVLFDAGVSSFQIDEGARGFSFNKEGALDMRMDNSKGKNAAELMNTLSQADLTHLIRKYGEEKFARSIATAIVEQRAIAPIETTLALAEIITRARPKRGRKEKLHPATRTFQALRIVVNDELGALEKSLEAGRKVLAENGRLIFITFHSLEDRIVKRFFHHHSGRGGAGVSRFVPLPSKQEPTLRLLSPKPIQACAEELGLNPRARSAKLRAAQKVAHL